MDVGRRTSSVELFGAVAVQDVDADKDDRRWGLTYARGAQSSVPGMEVEFKCGRGSRGCLLNCAS